MLNQPISSITSLIYAFFGGILIITDGPVLAYLGVTMLFLGLFSFLYHSLDKYIWQKADEISMYGVFIALFFWQWHQLTDTPALACIAAAMMNTAICGLFHKKLESFMTVGAMFTANLIFLAVLRGLGPAALVVGVFALGLWTRQLGIRWKAEKHTGSDYYHGGWHIITGLGIYLMTIV